MTDRSTDRLLDKLRRGRRCLESEALEPSDEEYLVDVDKVESSRWPRMDELREAIDDLDHLRRLAFMLPRSVERQTNPNTYTRAVLHGRSLAQCRVDALLGEYRRWAAFSIAQPSQ